MARSKAVTRVLTSAPSNSPPPPSLATHPRRRMTIIPPNHKARVSSASPTNTNAGVGVVLNVISESNVIAESWVLLNK